MSTVIDDNWTEEINLQIVYRVQSGQTLEVKGLDKIRVIRDRVNYREGSKVNHLVFITKLGNEERK